MSTAMILLALSIFAPWIAFSPTPPAPITATVIPARAVGWLITAPTPVVTEHPIRAATSIGTWSGIGKQACWAVTTCSPKTPSLPIW